MTHNLIGLAGFASGWMLLWAAAGAIPLVLHFLYRRRQTVVAWAAMRVLLQVLEKEAKRVHLEQLLLLVLRMLILVVLALALARPFWRSDDDLASTESRQPASTWIIAIDVSYSMSFRADAETRLHAAQRRATEIIETAPEGDAFALISLGRPTRPAIAEPTLDRLWAIAELNRLTINEAGCDLDSGLTMIAAISQRAEQDESLPPVIRIVILSDLGDDIWQSAVDGIGAKKLRELGSKFQLDIESFGGDSTSNVAITNIRPDGSSAIVGQPLAVDVTVKNFGATEVSELPVQFVVNNNTVASEAIGLSAQESKTLRFSYVPKAAAPCVLGATIPTDRLPADDRRWHIVDVRQGYDVLFVEQQPGDSRVTSLSLQPNKTAMHFVQPTSVSVFELASIDFAKWQVIILNDLVGPDSSNFARLERFVRAGGALVVLLGRRANSTVWNESESEQPLLGFELIEPSAIESWGIDPLDYRSPIVAPFAGFPDAGLLTTPIFRYWRIRSAAEGISQRTVDLATTQGEPLLTRHRLGNGSVTCMLSAPQTSVTDDGAWNAIATWPSFVPLMQRLLQTAMDTGSAGRTVLAGEPLLGRLRGAVPFAGQGSHTLTVVKPDKTTTQIVGESARDDGASPWDFGQTQQSGIYTVSDQGGSEQLYAVNVNLSESSLTSIRLEDLPKPSAPRALTRAWTLPRNATANSGFATALLMALGCLLVTESALAWALGKRAG